MTSDTLAMINAYLDGGHGSTMEQIILKAAYGDIVRLTAERDEARREACEIWNALIADGWVLGKTHGGNNA